MTGCNIIYLSDPLTLKDDSKSYPLEQLLLYINTVVKNRRLRNKLLFIELY